MSWINKALTAVAGIVAVAGAVAAIPLGLPAVVVAVALKVVLYGTTVGVIAAKVLPGHGENAPPVPAITPAKGP
jgi:hypothetical protein